MIILGAKGFAKEVLQIICLNEGPIKIAFYDDVNADVSDFLFGQFRVLKNEKQAREYFRTETDAYTLGVGNPLLRQKLASRFKELGGKLTSTISSLADIGTFDVQIAEGCNILSGARISNSVQVGAGCIIYYNSIVTHDCMIGDFVEISPAVSILGRCRIGSFSQIGSNATILPDIELGRNVVVGAGAVVVSDVPDNSVVAGVPAKVIRTRDPLGV